MSTVFSLSAFAAELHLRLHPLLVHFACRDRLLSNLGHAANLNFGSNPLLSEEYTAEHGAAAHQRSAFCQIYRTWEKRLKRS